MVFRSSITLVLIYSLLTGCQSGKTTDEPAQPFRTIDYVEVGKRMAHARPPYVIDLSNQEKSKRLLFIGCNHVRDSTDQQFALIQRYFAQLKPQIAFNEGGQVSESVHYPSLGNAVFKAGETGCLKYLSDQAGTRLLNGDTPDSLEFYLTLQRYPKEELYLYYVMERVVIPYLSINNQPVPFETYFNEGTQWLADHHFPLTAEEQTMGHFKKLYQKYVKRPFVPTLNEDVEKFDYINGGECHFCVIGRQSKMIRDSVLLTKLDRAFDQYDRIIVTFGLGHAIAIEPALRQIVNKRR